MSYWRSIRKRIHLGRRGTVLLLLGIGWLAMSFSVLQNPLPIVGASELWFASWPPLLRATLWGTTGLIAIVCAFRRNDALGWLALYFMPSQRAISYLIAYVHYLIPNDASKGLDSALSGFIIWSILVAVILVCAGWEEPLREEHLPPAEDTMKYKNLDSPGQAPTDSGGA